MWIKTKAVLLTKHPKIKICFRMKPPKQASYFQTTKQNSFPIEKSNKMVDMAQTSRLRRCKIIIFSKTGTREGSAMAAWRHFYVNF